ncbi:MerR family transcriptional regulator [Psychrobacillus sp. AK 1817]|uniref:MerR family transcriptional regulator n=1 Tax=Psychrobacillus sp. AK 1817 TaxID=2303505 RepID=UPI0012492720|nr:MerR family transcriptional regulator [Psychrobacillus sp. AK 1817]QEY21602.1 MerR family transcriptional regulator [Psychrobacillus sp. AK 1817]
MNSKQVAEMFDLSVDTLRYYERIGVIPPVTRDKNGYRNYQTSDLNWIFLVKSLRSAGLSIESLIEFASLARLRETQNVEEAQKQILVDQLEEIEKNIEKMKEVRSLLQYKIDTYDVHMRKFKSGELTEDKVEKLWEMKHFKKGE